jgi:hypothetical protein
MAEIIEGYEKGKVALDKMTDIQQRNAIEGIRTELAGAGYNLSELGIAGLTNRVNLFDASNEQVQEWAEALMKIDVFDL